MRSRADFKRIFCFVLFICCCCCSLCMLVYFVFSIIHRYLTWTTGSFTCICNIFPIVYNYTRETLVYSPIRRTFVCTYVPSNFITASLFSLFPSMNHRRILKLGSKIAMKSRKRSNKAQPFLCSLRWLPIRSITVVQDFDPVLQRFHRLHLIQLLTVHTTFRHLHSS